MLDLQWDLEEAKVAWFKQGRHNTMLENLRSVMYSLKVPVERAMEILNVPENERTYYVSKLESTSNEKS